MCLSKVIVHYLIFFFLVVKLLSCEGPLDCFVVPMYIFLERHWTVPRLQKDRSMSLQRK